MGDYKRHRHLSIRRHILCRLKFICDGAIFEVFSKFGETIAQFNNIAIIANLGIAEFRPLAIAYDKAIFQINSISEESHAGNRILQIAID